MCIILLYDFVHWLVYTPLHESESDSTVNPVGVPRDKHMLKMKPLRENLDFGKRG
ncbi:MAG: hypothetical protein ACI8RD_012094 [Bacillariaceae sp.]|jgi:hypothetical protein